MEKKCSLKGQCLAKALLDNVCPNEEGPAVYKLYFTNFTLADDDSNVSCLESRPEQAQKVFNSAYKIKDPTKEPAFFSFDSFFDLNRLAALLKKNIVIYASSDTKFQTATLYHDFRFLSTLDDAETLFFLVTRNSRILYKLRAECSSPPDCSYMSDRVVVHSSADDWGTTLQELTGLACPVILNSIQHDLHLYRQTLFETWRQPVLFVALCKVKLHSKTNACRALKPDSHHFVTVCLVGPPLVQLSHLDLESIEKVVCFVGGPRGSAGGQHLCLLNDTFRRHVLARLVVNSHKDKLSNADLANLPPVSKAVTAEAKKQRQETRKKYVTRAEQKGSKCKCEICSDASYNDNMSKVGPERLITYEPDVTELLTVLGLNSVSNLEAVKAMCELSVASMDIESTTITLDMYDPAKQATGVEYQPIDGVGLDGYLQKIQKPLMMAHLDSLMANGDPAVFVIDSDSEESIYNMLKDYWQFVRRRQKICQEAKEKLAAPMVKMIEEYSRAHVQFHLDYVTDCVEEEDDGTEHEKDVIGSSWRASIPGKLQRALSKLVSNYAVFSFYG